MKDDVLLRTMEEFERMRLDILSITYFDADGKEKETAPLTKQ